MKSCKLSDIFQFTPLREGRQIFRVVFVFRQKISIHAPPRGATSAIIKLVIFCRFQFTPLREGRHVRLFDSLPAPVFQFTPLREGRPAVLRVVFLFFVFQFTPLREGRRCREFCMCELKRISIHAPPRGATRFARQRGQALHISIHAPPRGATTFRPTARASSTYFNSRPSARGDIAVVVDKILFHISIHAPPRGAT